MDEKLFMGLALMVVGVMQDVLTLTNKFDMRGVAMVHLAMLIFLFILVRRERD